MSDFARLDARVDADRGATLHLYNPYDDELFYKDEKPITITLLGLDSTLGRRALARLARESERKKKGHRKEAEIWKKSVDEIMVLAEQGEESNAKVYAAITTGWSNIWFIEDVSDMSEEPKKLAFSEANALKLYTARTWIMEQVTDFLSDKANFAPNDEET